MNDRDLQEIQARLMGIKSHHVIDSRACQYILSACDDLIAEVRRLRGETAYTHHKDPEHGYCGRST